MRGRRMSRWTAWALLALLALCLGVLVYCAKKGTLDATLSPGDEVVLVKTLNSTSETVVRGGEVALTAMVVDVHGRPVAGREVAFSATSGTVPASAVTDEKGMAVVTFEAGSTLGTAVVTARVGENQRTLRLRVTDIAAGGITGQYRYALSSDVESILADGLDRAKIRATVTDMDGRPETGVRVVFSATLGTLSPSVGVTDVQGMAYSTLVSSASSTDTVAQVTAILDTSSVGKRVGQVSLHPQIEEAPPAPPSRGPEKTESEPAPLEGQAPSSLPKAVGTSGASAPQEEIVSSAVPLSIAFRGVTVRVEADQDSVPADGRNVIPLRVIVKETTSAAAVVGAEIRLGSTLGSIATKAITDETGEVRASLVSGTVPGTAVVTAMYGPSLSDTVSVRFTSLETALTLILRADPAVVQANGESEAHIRVLLRDTNNNPVEEAEIRFSTTLGTIPASVLTDQDGRAVVVLHSDRANGKAEITARYGTLVQTTVVLLSGVVLEMRVNPDNLIADGQTGSVITVSLKDAAGTPISGETVGLSTDLGVLDRSAGITDVYGMVTATLTSDASGAATVRAEGAGVTGSVQVSFTDYLLFVSAEPSEFSADESATLRARLLDNNRSPVEGVSVTFSTTLGWIEGTDGVGDRVTDASGQVEATLTSTQSGIALVTAVAETERGNVSSTVEVPISSAPPVSILLQVDPSIIAVDEGTAEVMAIVTDERGNPVADALVSFTFDGARGGAGLDPGTAMTNANGVAKTVFYSGSLASSKLGDVMLEARIEGIGMTSNRVTLTISGAPAKLTVGYTPFPEDNGDGTFDIPIAALVADINGNPVVDGTQVFFGVDWNVGVIQSPVRTLRGKATTRFTYPESTAGDTVEVQCQSGAVRDALPITLPGFSGTVAKVTLSASRTSILGNGMDGAQVRALVTDTKGNPVEDIMVTFASTAGQIVESAVTEPQYTVGVDRIMNPDWGIARVQLTSSAVEEDVVASVRASSAEMESSPLEIQFRGVTLEVVPQKHVIAAGGESLPVTVTLKETTSYMPLVGVPLRFGTSLGTIVGTANTDASGVARNVLMSGHKTGTARLVVFYGPEIKKIVEVQIEEMVLTGIRIMANPTSIQADGTSTSTITVLLRDRNNNPISDRTVQFSTTLGTVDAEAATDGNGRAVAHLISERRNGTAAVTARYEALEATTEVQFSGVTLDVRADPENLIANGTDASVIRATLRDPAGLPVAGETVRFSTTLGTLEAGEGKTDANGVATDVLTSSKAGEDVVRVQVMGEEAGDGVGGEPWLEAWLNVWFTNYQLAFPSPEAADGVGEDSETLIVIAHPDSSLTLTATLLDYTGAPVQGARVDFSTTLGWLSPPVGYTDSSGKVSTVLRGTGAGTATVVATAVAGKGETVSKAADVEILSALPAAISLVGSPTIVAVDGGTSSITAVVTDAGHNPVSEATVSFTIISGPHGGEILSPATVTTDFRGVASTSFQSGFKPSASPKDVEIVARVVGTQVESEPLTLTIAGAPQRVTVGYASPPEDNEDGTYALPVAAIVADISGNPVVDGTLVYFSTAPSIGVISSPVGTVEGIARTTLVYPANNAGIRISIRAESRGISGSADPTGGIFDSVELILPGSSGVAAFVKVSVTPDRLLGDGLATAELSAVVTDALDNPVGWVSVDFFAEHGTIVQVEGVTDYSVGWGKARATLISASTEAKEGLVDSVWAAASGQVSQKVPVVYAGVSMEVSVDPPVIAAEGEQATVEVVLKEAATTVPIEGAEVSFGTSLGSIVGTATTDASGVARSTLTSGDVSGTATITVAYGPVIRRTASVEITPVRGEDPASIVLVSAQPTTIGVKGSGDNETATIVFEVMDAYGIKVQDGTPIVFALAGGIESLGASLSPDTARTVDGRVSATLQSGPQAGTVKVVATSVDFPDVSSGAVSVAVHGGPPDEDHFSLAANKLNIAGRRFSGLEVLITAYLFDQYSNPVPAGTSISFRTTGGGIEGSAVTDESGWATVRLISAKPWPENGFATVTAQTVGRDGPIEADIHVLFSGSTGPILVVDPDPPYITVPDGGRQAFVFYVGDDIGNPLVEGTKIQVTATGGSVTGDVDVTLADTQSRGATFYAFIFEDKEGDDTLPQVKIVVTSENGDREGVITAAPPSPLSVQLAADRQTVLADGASTVTLTAAVVDMAGYPISGQAVTFTSDIGSLPSFAATDAEGRAEVVWTSIPSTTDRSATVIAQTEGLADTLTVALKGVALGVYPTDPTVLADGVSTVEVIAQYAETTSDAPIVGETIRFTAFDDRDGDGVQDAGEETVGVIGASGVTDASGQAKVTFTGEISAEERRARIRATVAGLSDTTSVQLLPVTLTRNIVLLVTPTVLVADGRSTSEITVTVTQNGYPVPDGTVVRFSLTPQKGSLGRGEQVSTVGGLARNTLTSSYTPGTDTLRAWIQGDPATVEETEITYLVGPAETVTVEADATELPADGITSTTVTATVKDAVGNPLANVEVTFASNIGDVAASASTDEDGVAAIQFSGDVTGTAVVTATAAGVSGHSPPIFMRPGPPHSILLKYNPTFVGIRGVGHNATVIVTAEVRDSHGNFVADETGVEFFIFSSPSRPGDVYRDELSTTDPVPTVNGIAQVAFTSGSRSGTAQIGARVNDIEAASTEFQIFSGPPYIEDASNPSPDPYEVSSHLAIGAGPINILGWNRVNSRTTITVVVGDKYNNPVPEGTAVYFTTTGGVVATATGYVDEYGVASVILITGAPFPTVDRYHGLLSPNIEPPESIPGDPPNFDGIDGPNDGIARVLATSEGVDSTGASAIAWGVCDVVFSGAVEEFSFTKNTPVEDMLWIGQSAGMTIWIRDINGNPIVPESVLTAETTAGALSWTTWTTGDPGQIEYGLSVGNDLAPKEPGDETEFKPALVTVKLDSPNGMGGATLGFVLVNEEEP